MAVEVSALMTKYAQAFRAAGAPADARVFSLRTNVNKVYYFSPETVVFAGELLRQFDATDCDEAPEFYPALFAEVRV
jgi:hypothetical protein